MPERRDYRTRLDRIVVPILTGPLGRGFSFVLAIAQMTARSIRGETRHPDERRAVGE